MGSLCGMTVYIYALAMNPDWALSLVPIPSDLCNAEVVVRGVMYVIILLCAMELLLSLYLLEGARQVHIYFLNTSRKRSQNWKREHFLN